MGAHPLCLVLMSFATFVQQDSTVSKAKLAEEEAGFAPGFFVNGTVLHMMISHYENLLKWNCTETRLVNDSEKIPEKIHLRFLIRNHAFFKLTVSYGF